jgi:hypothetical protein
MAHVSPFDTSTPAGNADPRDGDDRIREAKAALYERFILGGIYWDDSGTPDNNAGKICAGVQSANSLIFYETDKTTAMVTHDDSAQSVTLGDGKNGANQYSMVAHLGDFHNVTAAGTLSSTGGLSESPIVGGTPDRKLNFTAGGSVVAAASAETDMVTGSTITCSADSNTPSRVFMVAYNATARANAGSATIGMDITCYYDLAGAGWTAIPTVAGGDVHTDIRTCAPNIGDLNVGFVIPVTLASINGQTLRFKVSCSNLDATDSATLKLNQLTYWEVMITV